MNRSVAAALIAGVLFWVHCSSVFAADVGSQTETRRQNNVRQMISRTVDPLAPSIGFLDGAGRIIGNPFDATGSLMWQTSDPTGMMNNLAISDDGSIAAIFVDLNNMRLQVYNGQTGDLIYEIPAGPDMWGNVAVSGAGDRVVYGTGTVVSLLPSDNSTPIWTSDPGPGLAVVRVGISRDGQHILAMEGVTAFDQDSVHLWAFTPASATPVWSLTLDYATKGEFYGATFSADGSRVVITTRQWLSVLDPTNGAFIWEGPAFNTQYAAGMSGDGRVITCGSNNDGKIRVYHWDPGQQTYILFWNYTFTGGTSNWGTATAVSANGETVAGGSLQFIGAGYAGYVAVFDTYGDGTPLWTPVDMADLVGDVNISDDGLTIAACSWGPFTGDAPADIQVWDKYDPVPFYTYAHPGSPNDVALSPDGTRLFAGGKATHNRQFGNGGYAYMYLLDLEGGTVTGTVTLQGTGDYSGVTVENASGDRHTMTDVSGAYQLEHIPAGTHTIIAHKLGFTTGSVPNVVITDGGTVPDVNFALDTSDVAPTNLTASQNHADHIQLNWAPATIAGLQEREHQKRVAAGDEVYYDPRGTTPLYPPVNGGRLNFGSLDDLDEADSIRVWRSALSGGPYSAVATLPGTATTYSDDLFGLRPGVNYYFVVTAVYANAESEYSNEALGRLDDSYIDYSPTVPPMVSAVTFDGVLAPNEWTDAVMIDISDVMGYDGQDPPGTAFLYLKYDDTNDLLFVAAEDHANTTIDSAEGIGFYVDDDDNDAWTYSQPGSEGNYWAYWFPSGSTLRYRSLSGGPWGGSPYVFPNPQLGFSAAAGYLTMEVAIPMSFHYGYDIALYGPDRTPGVGAFIIQRNGPNPIFHGWWPQDMPSIVSNPDYFSATTINAMLFVPPQPPSSVLAVREGTGIHVTWIDPTLGIDNLPLQNLDGINVYRNGQFVDVLPPGTQTWTDNFVVFGGWYEYSLAGFIPEGAQSFEGPQSYPQGVFAGAEPLIVDLFYDDGEWDGFQIPAYPYDGNREGVRFERPIWANRVYTVQILCNTDGLIGIGVAENDNGIPGLQLAGPYWFRPPAFLEYVTFHFPGTDAPFIEQDSFWVTLDWQPDDVWNPGMGTDQNPPFGGPSAYYTNATGWQFTPQNFMIRTGVGDTPSGSEEIPSNVVNEFRLFENYPNPFNPSTEIRFDLSQAVKVELRIFNVLGREVATLVDEMRAAGSYQMIWDGKDLSGADAASGVYVYRLKAGDFVDAKKMVLMK